MTVPWNSPEREITPESVAFSRRKWLKAAGWTVGLGAVSGLAWWYSQGGTDVQVLEAGLSEGGFPEEFHVERNRQFAEADRPLTDRAEAARYCNFYEFSRTKSVYAYVDRFRPSPWTLEVTGLVGKPRTFDLDSLQKSFTFEERIYRHRCVETWAMVVPWVGFAFADLIRMVEPTRQARFVKMETFFRPEEATHQQTRGIPWPYTEGLSIEEANNPLAFLAVGMYGKPLLKQNGAPIRLVVPWKYGFKSIKSIVRIEFVGQQPSTFWNSIAPGEYDFWANVNPQVPHPRWSQASEWMLGTGQRYPTQPYNGYGEWVGKLYQT